MEISLDGKVALVTGASKGIGKAIASSLAASGAKVMINSRKQDQLEAARAEMTGEVEIFAGNAGDADAGERVSAPRSNASVDSTSSSTTPRPTPTTGHARASTRVATTRRSR
jgi:NAD(P)-dependent dehydrogenase (short-subunit alcohol dehydrogenase family)